MVLRSTVPYRNIIQQKVDYCYGTVPVGHGTSTKTYKRNNLKYGNTTVP